MIRELEEKDVESGSGAGQGGGSSGNALAQYACFAALFVMALELGWWGEVFAVFNAQYSAEYGGMNMGDAAGIFLLWTPTAFIALIGAIIVSAGVRRYIIEKEELRASAGSVQEGTDDTRA